ncbi:MAG: hypothetical protein PHE24_02845 [Patescibacteria group bacterium]|nr:hypothetical protein [Patescibacteria group bacterium]
MSKIQGWKIAAKRGKKKNRIPPFAPSGNELAVYQKYLARAAKDRTLPKRALTLGATPELRDGAIAAGLESVAVDVSRTMMKKFSGLMEKKNNPLDKKVIGNWLTMDFPAKSFGVIMGDGALNNLAARRENEKLIKVCSSLLPVGGYLVLRQVVFTAKFKTYKNAKMVVEDFRKKKLSWVDMYMELRYLVYKKQVYNSKTFQSDNAKAFKMIDGLCQQSVLSKKEYDRINLFRNKVINTVYPENKFIKLVERQGFELVEKFHDRPHRFFKYLYLMVFKRV